MHPDRTSHSRAHPCLIRVQHRESRTANKLKEQLRPPSLSSFLPNVQHTLSASLVSAFTARESALDTSLNNVFAAPPGRVQIVNNAELVGTGLCFSQTWSS
eukprot:436461-Rhodomonas_salina.1